MINARIWGRLGRKMVAAFGLSLVALASPPVFAAGSVIIGGSSSTSITANAVCDPGGGVCNATVTSMIGMRIPMALTIKNLYASQATAAASANSCTFTIRSSAGCTAAYTATALTCTLAAGSKSCQNTSSTATVAAGDCLQLYFVESGTCQGFINWGFQGDYP